VILFGVVLKIQRMPSHAPPGREVEVAGKMVMTAIMNFLRLSFKSTLPIAFL
jgi:hypothetical protein